MVTYSAEGVRMIAIRSEWGAEQTTIGAPLDLLKVVYRCEDLKKLAKGEAWKTAKRHTIARREHTRYK